MGLFERQEARKRDHGKWFDAKVALVAGLGGSLIGAVVVLAGILVTHVDVNQQQSVAVEEDHSAEARDKRSQIYPAYLHAAAAYRDATHSTWLAVQLRQQTGAPYATLYPTLKTFEEARRSYQDQRTLLAMYGSDRAWTAQRDMAASLLPAYGKVKVEADADYDRFDRGYRAFLGEFCKDVNPEIEPDCRQAQAVVPGR
ncbi:hypothetical protein [Kribbella sp. VKM Ac-2566]|uniref:hypothetical protein n=1 Tax=Kribbella sp. VKM Ac-2566 TaxID=2512218 RepID=UPI001063B995|nr:hypothetical protein [Kribbella sp. VKM Ac-2566]TDW98498.1 hypothetical protein EV647_3207 [Kribbella sp. VKM Ac-2566]